MSRLRGGAFVFSDAMSRFAASVTSSTARLNAASFALEGRVAPLSLRTNCSADARISSSVAGGSKLASVLMFRHICNDLAGDEGGNISKLSRERGPAYSLDSKGEARSARKRLTSATRGMLLNMT